MWDNCAGLNAATDKTSKNPKIRGLIDEIINDGSIDDHTTPPEKNSPVDLFGEIALPLPPPTIVGGVYRERLLPKASPPEVVADTFQEKAALFQEGPSSEIESPPRTKGDIIGYSEDSESDESIDINANVKFLPATVEGLRKRFHELYTEFPLEGKHEHRNELVFLLDELLRKGGINREEYRQLNNTLAESLGSGIELAEEDKTEDDKGNLQKLIQSTIEYSIQHDKKELLELMNEFRKDVDEDFLDTALELEELVDVYLLEEFLEKEPIRIKIDEVRRKLVGSDIFKSKQHRLKILLDDIAQNLHRMQTILMRMADAAGEDAFTITQLASEELLSEEQHLKLADALLEEEFNSERLVDVIKDTKIGQGFKFLLRRKEISHERYITIKEDNNIL